MLNMKSKQKRIAGAGLKTSPATRVPENLFPEIRISCFLLREKGWPAWQS